MDRGKITEINVDSIKKWNKTVRSFADYDVFYLNEYVHAFQKENAANGEPILIYYEKGTERAINVIFKRDIADDPKFYGKIKHRRYFDLITPYGYGGFWGNITDWDSLNASYSQYCAENMFICEFVRFELFSEYAQYYPGHVESRTHNVVRKLDIPLEDIWMDFKPKVRKNVKKANSYGLKFIVDYEAKYLDDFLKIYYSTMDRTEAHDEFYFSRDFFIRLNKLNKNAVYFYVVHNGKIISAELVIYGSKNAYSYLGGTDREYFDLRPNDFLKYEIIKWCKEKGLENFVLGGGYGADDGIFQYKQCLAPHGIVDFYIGRRVFDSDSYNSLVEMRRQADGIQNNIFFPTYRE